MDRDLNCASLKKVQRRGRQTAAKDLWHTAGLGGRGRKGAGEEDGGWMKVVTSSALGYHSVSGSRRTRRRVMTPVALQTEWE